MTKDLNTETHKSVESWGRYPKLNSRYTDLVWRPEKLPMTDNKDYLAFGLGRSYGDVCLTEHGQLLGTRFLDNIISFDTSNGVIKAEAGLSIFDLHQFSIQKGWFVPVTPGTQFVTLGGAVANDVHGKNHHSAGTFGRHVKSIGLLRSDNQYMELSPSQNQELFNATIAGLGLTGLIVWIELQLIPIKNSFIENENRAFQGLEEFFSLSQESSEKFDYTVAWLDCVSTGKDFARGIFMRGNHSQNLSLPLANKFEITLPCPIDFPSFTLNRYTVKAFNNLYYLVNANKTGLKTVSYRPFFYPLDSVANWNRIYGKQGFLQFQCVLPKASGPAVLKELLQIVVAAGQASFLAVLKEFGDLESPGLLSFPRAGTTLCLDFPMRGADTLQLMSKLESLVMQAGGALYPAKDACMQAESFKAAFPNWQEFSKLKDPNFSSAFWSRVTL